MPIVDKLKEALKPGRRDSADDGELGRLLASSAKKVLLQKLEFEPASKSFSYQLESLKSKYVLLNPRPEGAGCPKSGGEPPGAGSGCHRSWGEPPAIRQGWGAGRAGRGLLWADPRSGTECGRR